MLCSEALPAQGRSEPVARLVEKPDRSHAETLMQGGRCLWNAGIFVWTAEAFLREVEQVCPELAALTGLLERGEVDAFFRQAPRMPVDRAVLARSKKVWVVAAQVGWEVLGDWESMARRLPADADGSVGQGLDLAIGCSGCVVHSPGKPVVLLGVEHLIVVECDDVLLVAARDSGQRLREVAALLEDRGRRDLT